MKIHGNDIVIHRGETFTLSMNVKMRDGTPFIMTYNPRNEDEAHNPYILITIASSKYAQKGSYIKNWWLPMKSEEPEKSTPSFTSTEIKTLTDSNQGSSDGYNDDGIYERYLYYNQQDDKYYYYDDGFKEYAFKIHKAFTYEETNELVSQSYYYSVTYVDGELNYNDDGELLDERIKNFTQVTPIISPSKLTVLSNLRGGL